MIQVFTIWVPRSRATTMDDAFEYALRTGYRGAPSGAIRSKSDYMEVSLRVQPSTAAEATDVADALLPHGYDNPRDPAWVICVDAETYIEGGWLFFGSADSTRDERIRG